MYTIRTIGKLKFFHFTQIQDQI